MYSQTCCRLLYLLVLVQVQVFLVQSSVEVQYVYIYIQVQVFSLQSSVEVEYVYLSRSRCSYFSPVLRLSISRSRCSYFSPVLRLSISRSRCSHFSPVLRLSVYISRSRCSVQQSSVEVECVYIQVQVFCAVVFSRCSYCRMQYMLGPAVVIVGSPGLLLCLGRQS